MIAPDRQEAHFSLSEAGSQIPVVCKGPLPDDLSTTKTMDVVVEGRLEDTCTLQGDKLITRCASKYNAKKDDAQKQNQHRPPTSRPGRPCDDFDRATLPAGGNDLGGLCGLCGDCRCRSEGRGLGRSAVGAAFTAVAALSVVVVVLGHALVTKDFPFEYVTEYSDPLLPWHYSLSALWVGQAGSLLVWGWFVALLAIVFRFTSRAVPRSAGTGLRHADDLSASCWRS